MIKKTTTPAKIRTQYLKVILYLLNEFDHQKHSKHDTLDLIGLIYLTLLEVEKTMSATTLPWEKRGFWIKVEHFNEEWKWVVECKRSFVEAYQQNQWCENPEIPIRLLKDKLKEQTPLKATKQKIWPGAYSKAKALIK